MYFIFYFKRNSSSEICFTGTESVLRILKYDIFRPRDSEKFGIGFSTSLETGLSQCDSGHKYDTIKQTSLSSTAPL